MITIQFLTSQSCSECFQAKQILKEAKAKYPNLKIEEYDVMCLKGLELAVKYGIMANPGVIINGELFSVGSLDKEKLFEKISNFH
ncbi:thioredoxin family protein [Candidatus Roizmanbacteria bacterium]|nr:thioredoxin family protein [Candidatus Roizmanbacteria bacterium]